jgi:hypothetical protein
MPRVRPVWFLWLLGGLAAYEVAALADTKNGHTISEITWRAVSGRPIVPFLAGVIAGHLFWQHNADPPGRHRP